MVDCYGRWIEESDYATYPKEKWCDMDYVAAWIINTGYQPKTSMKNLVEMIFAHYDVHLMDEGVKFFTDIEESENGLMISIVDISEYVNASGGLEEFDYEC